MLKHHRTVRYTKSGITTTESIVNGNRRTTITANSDGKLTTTNSTRMGDTTFVSSHTSGGKNFPKVSSRTSGSKNFPKTSSPYLNSAPLNAGGSSGSMLPILIFYSVVILGMIAAVVVIWKSIKRIPTLINRFLK